MNPRARKSVYFILEGLNSFATSYYFFYLFFSMSDRFGFGNADNLTLSAWNGLVYMLTAWLAGRFGQRRGYFRALRLGFIGMAVALAAGSPSGTVAGQYVALTAWTISLCFVWPALEALVSEGETASGMQWMVGLYNVVWAGSSALAYFLGGAILDRLGPASLYWLPVGIHLIQWALTWLVDHRIPPKDTVDPARSAAAPPGASPGPASLNPRFFLRLSWLSNPFAYMATNTVAAVTPDLAARLGLSLIGAGLFCSIWFFARLGAFFLLWGWPGWHYRLRWLAGAYGLLVASFVALLLAPSLWIAAAAQIGLGSAVGLIYYSSLYYSMNVGDAKGDHGGIHESAIGVGLFTGPAMGALGLRCFPGSHSSSTWAVGGLLCIGGALILAQVLRQRRKCRGGIAFSKRSG
ncbi:MAG TPA: MFS transporter [Candidatus Paceibacterota bacterium]|nr:hypothetical protein [Verrucomicrobiota bacterium]HOX04441.1 MFS transporter [Verrucomicrobiota bacterium]HRZ47354.1 MFS transporter [Candidatus Paceibacterota bacterium]HRZ93601.1 MFS transporter [Candidatus Paceibacterota bacterium]